ncbi:MAG: hypothetical protein ACKVU4_00460 [Phycisphaerales bacterium]
MVARAQFGPMSSACADPWPINIPYRCGNCQWFPDPPNTTAWADRRPTAEIRLSNGNYVDNDRGLLDLWWDATFDGPPITCTDTLVDEWSAFDIESNWFSLEVSNGRPDQFDWLIAHLDHRYALGYRRIVLYAPAGVASCQFVPPSQWWPMAEWRRDWFEETGVQGQPHTWGLAGWIDAHPDVQVGIYMGWAIENPCSLCMQTNIAPFTCTIQATCPGALMYPCFGAPAAHYPLTTNQTDMGKTWQNVAPWREVGVQRFWLDFAAVSAHNGSTELLQFAYNPALFSDSIAPLIFGGEAFPLSDENAIPAPDRYTVDWAQFAYMPFVIELWLAEKHYFNGAPCPVPYPPVGHTWSLPTLASQRREAAIWPVKLPTCPDGSVHPDWNGAKDEGPHEYYYPFERLENLYQWYICKGFTFWQGGANEYSGFAERLFSFGKIDPPGDFDGDGERTPADWAAYDAQYTKWSNPSCIIPETHVLTYFHGDMDSDGDVDELDKDWAEFVIRDGNWGDDPWWLGDGGPLGVGDHTMLWNPNQKWLPCECETPPSSAFGPP